MYKASYLFNFLINTPYFKTKKGTFPVQACPRPDRGKNSLTYLYIKLLFVELIKIVIINIRIYKDMPLGGKSMAYCPKCEKNYPIVTSTSGSSYSVPVTTERYNSEGNYIGYEEGETSSVDIKTLPRCSNCFSVFEFPNAISKEEFFYAKRDQLLRKWRNLKPVYKPANPSLGCAIFGVFLFLLGGGVAEFIASLIAKKNDSLAGFIEFFAIVGVGFGAYYLVKSMYHEGLREYPEKLNEYEYRMAGRDKILNELQSLTYSHKNYKRLIKPQPSKKAVEKHKETLSQTEVRKAMEKILENNPEKVKEEALEDEMFQRML
jgi:hypothetical protein